MEARIDERRNGRDGGRDTGAKNVTEFQMTRMPFRSPPSALTPNFRGNLYYSGKIMMTVAIWSS